MKFYEIKKTSENPDWSILPSLEINTPYLDTPDAIKAYAQICYNDKAILVHLSTVEKDILANQSGPLGMPCRDSCLEFFFCPLENDQRYINLEFNMNGCMYLGYGKSLPELTRLIVDPVEVFAPKISKTSDGWEIFYTIPYTFIRRFFPDFSVKSGKAMRANCYKCADLSNPPHYLSWNRVATEPSFTFHNPDCFGEMIFD